jgi:hypothetical protein
LKTQTKQRRRTLRMQATCEGVPHLSIAESLRDESAPFDDEATTAEVWQLAAQIRAKGLELTRGRSVLDVEESLTEGDE